MARETIPKLGLIWAGQIYGTNTGKLSLEIEEKNDAYVGVLRVMDTDFGLAVYSVTVSFDGTTLDMKGTPKISPEGVEITDVQAKGDLNDLGNIVGQWETVSGTGGSFELFPHDRRFLDSFGNQDRPLQFFTKRAHFGPVEIGKADLIVLAESFKRDFPQSDIIVTTSTETEQSTYLEQFRTAAFTAERATLAKIFVQRPEKGGLNRTLSLEFGPDGNFAVAQSIDEAWAIGRIEKLKMELKQHERIYSLNAKRLGIGVNQVLFVGMLVFIPSIENLIQRGLYVIVVLTFMILFAKLHQRWIPNAAIYLNEPKPGALSKIGMRFSSWALGIFTAAATAIITTKVDQIWTVIQKFFQ